MTLRTKLALLFVLLLLSVTPILAQTDEPTPAETPAPVVTTPPVQADDAPSWREMLIIFFAGVTATLVIITGGVVYVLRLILSSSILRDAINKLADSIPPAAVHKLLEIAANFKEIGTSVTEILTEDVPPVPVGQDVTYKQE